MDVLSLLESKNGALRRYLEASLDFLAALEAGDTSRVEHYQERRDAILRAFELFDRKAGEAASMIRSEQRTPDFLVLVRRLLEEKKSLLERITDADVRIVGLVEKECESVRSQIASSRKGKDAISKFKSSWVKESGEGLDTKL